MNAANDNRSSHGLRIAFLCEYPSLNGGERSLLAALDELGTQVQATAIVPPQGDLADAFRARHVPVVALPGKAVDDGDLADLLSRLPVDIVHANSLMMSRRLARLAVTVRSLCTGHVRDVMQLSGQAVTELQQLDQLICVSHDAQRALLAQGVAAARTTVIHNGIDLQRFQRQPRTGALHRELGLPVGTKLVLNVGQICLRKGQDKFAAAAVGIARERTDIQFLHCGARHSTKAESIAYDERLEAIFAEAGLSAHWHRLGPREDVPRLLNEVDLLLHCARQEPLGRVLLEAAAMETPTVATDVGGTREIIEHNVTGVIVPRDDVPAMIDNSLHLLEQPHRARQLATAARCRCESQFSITLSARRTLDLWQRRLAAGKLT